MYDKLEDIVIDLDRFDNADVVLFSPASESYDQFKNFEERGKYFKKIVLNKFQNVL